MEGKAVRATSGETRKVTNNWTADCEKRGTTISSSAWTHYGAGSVSSEALDGFLASALVAASCVGLLVNTVTLANGEVLVNERKVGK